MTRTIALYGLIAGAIIAAFMAIGSLLADPGDPGLASHITGFASMFVALSMIVLGVKHYRDNSREGRIGFVQGVAVGLGIAVLASSIYTFAWEVYLAATDYRFIESYTTGLVEQAQERGATSEELLEIEASNKRMIDMYDILAARLFITFMEMFMIGGPIALITAAVFRFPGVLPKKRPATKNPDSN